jgi:tetratricopeptide (TPR) repeat protein
MLVLAGCTTRQEYTTMRQGLDSINERNRNDEPFTASDVQPYVDYFDRHGEPNDRLLAHYLLGRAYHEQGEAPMALQCYQQAIECADTLSTDCDFAQLSRVFAQMGNIFYNQSLYHNYLIIEKDAEHFSWIAKDTITALICHELQSVAYRELGNFDSSVVVIEETAQLFSKFGYSSDAAISLGSIVPTLLNIGKIEKAKKYISIYESESGFFDKDGDIIKGREAYYNAKGLLYLKENKLDSAEYWYRKELQDGKDFNNQNGGAFGLAMVYEQRYQPDSAAKYYQYAYAMNDSMYAQMTTSEVERMQAMYDYTRHQEMARKAEQKAERAKTGIIAILAVGVVILAIGAFFYQQYRNKKKAEIQQLNNDYGRALLEYNKLSAELERMKQQDGSLIFDKQQEVEELKARLQAYQAALQTNGTSQQLSVFQESSIMQTFRKKSKVSPQTSLPTETEWKRLVSQFSRSLPYAYAALGRDVILSTNELRVCILLLSGFKIADVAVLLGTSPQSVTNLKARANNKLFGESSASTLERNLMNTVGLA